MTSGPFGGPRPFTSDEKNVLVLVGIDGQHPPNDILLSLEESVRVSINQDISANFGVNLNTQERPSQAQKEALGPRLLYSMQFEVETPWEEISQKHINAIHNEVVGELNELGFNISGTKTTVV